MTKPSIYLTLLIILLISCGFFAIYFVNYTKEKSYLETFTYSVQFGERLAIANFLLSNEPEEQEKALSLLLTLLSGNIEAHGILEWNLDFHKDSVCKHLNSDIKEKLRNFNRSSEFNLFLKNIENKCAVNILEN